LLLSLELGLLITCFDFIWDPNLARLDAQDDYFVMYVFGFWPLIVGFCTFSYSFLSESGWVEVRLSDLEWLCVFNLGDIFKWLILRRI